MNKVTLALAFGALLPVSAWAQTGSTAPARVDTVYSRSQPLGRPVEMPPASARRLQGTQQRTLQLQQEIQRLQATQRNLDTQRAQVTERLQALRRSQGAGELQLTQRSEALRSQMGRVREAQNAELRALTRARVQGVQRPGVYTPRALAEVANQRRLEELRLSLPTRAGAFRMPGLMPDMRNLNLTEEQRAKMRSISEHEQKRMNEKRMKLEREMRKDQAESQKKMLDVLTKEQRRMYEQMHARQGGREQM